MRLNLTIGTSKYKERFGRFENSQKQKTKRFLLLCVGLHLFRGSQ